MDDTVRSCEQTQAMGALEPAAQGYPVPVLIVAFNRPAETRQVFAAVRAVRPTRLYVAVDAPRPQCPEDPEKVAEVRSILSQVDWPCELKTLFRAENRGCKYGPAEAIRWMFEAQEWGVILEDDCVPSSDFFTYVAELLARFQYDRRIMAIAGFHIQGSAHRPPESYFFSHYFYGWGWATWRRALDVYDLDMKAWPALRTSRWLHEFLGRRRLVTRAWQRRLDRAYSGDDVWDFQWLFSCWTQNAMVIYPGVNLVQNIGFGTDATHSLPSDEIHFGRVVERMDWPLRHPADVRRDVLADRWVETRAYRMTWLTELEAMLREIMLGNRILHVGLRWLRRRVIRVLGVIGAR